MDNEFLMLDTVSAVYDSICEKFDNAFYEYQDSIEGLCYEFIEDNSDSFNYNNFQKPIDKSQQLWYNVDLVRENF